MNLNLTMWEENKLLEEKYNGIKSKDFLEDVKKLRLNYPLAYLIGNIDFINIKIDLEFRPLIPRPETEFWIYEYIFPKIKNNEDFVSQNHSLKILDIFSGSGCIGISLLNNFEKIFVDFGEIKKENILQIKKNIQINNLEKTNFNIYQSDIFEQIPKKKYNLILANPPYISKDRIDTVQKSVLDFEDERALFANDDGLSFIKKLIQKFKNYLEKNGELWIEFDPWQKELILDFLEKEKIQNFEFKEDQYKKERFLKIIF